MRRPCSVETRFFRVLNQLVEPRVRAGWGSPRIGPGGLIVLETRGARTGRRSRVPLMASRIQGHVLVSTVRGRRSQWVKNLAANPDVRYWSGGRPTRARALLLAPGRGARVTRSLPATLRWLLAGLAPYTHAGWAFALLAPAKERALGRGAASVRRAAG